MPETLMLGDIDLGSFVKPKTPKTNLEQIEAKLDELGGPECSKGLPSEKVPAKLLYLERVAMEYPLIDTSFLSMSSSLDFRYREGFFRPREKSSSMRIPRFSVYPFYGDNRFDITLDASLLERFKRLTFHINWKSGSSGSYSYPKIPEVFLGQIAESFGLTQPQNIWRTDSGQPVQFDYFIQNPDLYQRLTRFLNGNSSFDLVSRFNGLIPRKTKEKAEKAKRFFDLDSIFIVSETKPSEWNITQRLTRDPLVIGVIDTSSYLIDHFNTTPMEDYVRREFLK